MAITRSSWVLVNLALLALAAACGGAEGDQARSSPLFELADPAPIFDSQKALASCGGMAAPSCGATLLNQCSQSSDVFTAAAYTCIAASIDLDGSEWVQRLTAPASGDLVISAANGSGYPFVAVLRDSGSAANPADCVRANWYSLRLTAGTDFSPGESLWLVVDHPEDGANLAFDVRVVCDAAASESDCTSGFDDDGDLTHDCRDTDCIGGTDCPYCQPAGTLSCGQKLVTVDTGAFGATDQVNRYACLPSLSPTASETAFTFTPTQSGDVVFTASHANRYPMLMVLKEDGHGCMTGDCLTGSYYSTRFAAQAGQTYYLLLDASEGPTFNADVSVICDAPTSEADCGDDIDEDGDWLADCDDPDCALSSECVSSPCEIVADVSCSTRRLAGNTGAPSSTDNTTVYSCMPDLDLNHPENAYAFTYTGGPASREVLVTLSNESSYATVAVLNDLSIVELQLTITNHTTSPWSQGLLATEELIRPGRTPRNGDAYFTYSFGATGCNLSDGICGSGCNDTGRADVLAERRGLILGQDAWLVPALAPGASANVTIRTSVTNSLSYVAWITNSADDLVVMHVVGNTSDTTVPLSDANGDGIDPVPFAISGYDLNSRSSTNGNGTSCSPTCPVPANGCWVTMNNGTTGGNLAGQASGGELVCNPNQCIAGNYYGATFTAVRDKTYWVVVEGAYQPGVNYELSVVCDPEAAEVSCGDAIDNDGDYAIDCDDTDCDGPCSQGNLCAPQANVDCATLRLAGSTGGPGSTTAIANYACQPGLVVGGGETTYTFVATQTGWVNFTTSGRSGYLSVAVLEDEGAGCDPGSCVAANYYGQVAWVEAGKTYYVVVDGYDTTPVDYELSVLCNPSVSESACSDGLDNDGDWRFDCDDSDCGC